MLGGEIDLRKEAKLVAADVEDDALSHADGAGVGRFQGREIIPGQVLVVDDVTW